MPRSKVPVCSECNRRFTNSTALKQHLGNSPKHQSHGRYKPYPCTSCNRSFGDQSALNNHTRALHQRGSCTTSNKPYPCTSCNRSFVHEGALKSHIRMTFGHDSRDAKCPLCPSYFTSPSAVARHIESGCHGITRNQVTHAVKSLDIVPNICITQRIEGASPTPETPTIINYFIASPRSPAFTGKAYACLLCQRMFQSLSSLSDHLNSAAHDANEFKCPKCKKGFKLISSLFQHIESATCKLAGLQQIQDHFEGLTAQFSRLQVISF